MNKAFVREPDFDGRAFCPRCGSLGTTVSAEVLDHHIPQPIRKRMQDAAWFCPFPRCEVAYFNLFDSVVVVDDLSHPIYPKDLDAPICSCFGLGYDDVQADVDEGVPRRIRALMSRAASAEARCAVLSPDGECCLREVQRLYMKLRT